MIVGSHCVAGMELAELEIFWIYRASLLNTGLCGQSSLGGLSAGLCRLRLGSSDIVLVALYC